MLTSQHILVPIDLSVYAERVLDYALTFTSAIRTPTEGFTPRLTLLHVVETPLLPEGLRDSVALALPQLEASRRRTLEDDYASRVRAAGLECFTAVMIGVPFQAIVDAAQARQVDLIIMGTHGHSGIPHMLLGSVADRVLRLAPCPVLVVRSMPGQ
jgi:universal stress protein A